MKQSCEGGQQALSEWHLLHHHAHIPSHSNFNYCHFSPEKGKYSPATDVSQTEMMQTSLPETIIQTQLFKWQAQHTEKELPEAINLLLEDHTCGKEVLIDKHYRVKHNIVLFHFKYIIDQNV